MTHRQAWLVSRSFRLLGACSILIGCFIVSLPFVPILLPIQPKAASPQVVEVSSSAISGYPTRIIIPKLDLSVPVFAVPYAEESWTVPTGGAAILTNPTAVGARGQVIYGHNWRSVFASLTKANPGDIIATEYANGQRKLYTVTEVFTTDSTDPSALTRGSDTSLSIYTCTGWLDSKRIVVVAEPLE